MNFKDKIVLVTGSNRGIGNEVVQALLQRGAKKIYAASRNPDSQPAISDSRVIPLKLDITDSDQIQNAVSIAQDIDILFNNAGIAAFTSLLDGPEDLLRRDMETNYFGTLNMIRAFVPVLEQKEQASIINVVTIGVCSIGRTLLAIPARVNPTAQTAGTPPPIRACHRVARVPVPP